MIDEIGGDFLQWLRGFYFVAKNSSLTHACSEMGRNQPAISHQIKSLEEEFGVILFDRSRGKMELTVEGKAFLEKTVSIFEIVKEMKWKFSKDYLENRGEITIAASHAIIHYFLPKFIIAFSEKFPEVNFTLEGGGVDIILERVNLAEADFGIASLNAIPDSILYLDLFETNLHLIAPKNNNFFHSRKPSLETIAKAPFIFFPHSSTISPQIKNVFAEKCLKLNVAIVLNNFESVKKYVELGKGVSILDDYTLEEDDKNRFDIYDVNRFFKRRTYGLIMRKHKYISPPTSAFLRYVKPDINF